MKMIMAAAVVMIHAPLILTPDNLYQPLTNEFLLIPVQFFFVASGFLMMHKINSVTDCAAARQIVRTRSQRTGKLWLRWLVLYLFLIPVYFHDVNKPLIKMVRMCVTDLVFAGSPAYAWPLWFLYSMTIGLALIYWAYGHKWRMRLLIMAVALLTLTVWGFSHLHISALKHIYSIAHFSLLAAIPILCGMMLYRLDRLGRLNYASVPVFLVAAVLMTIFYLPFDNLVGGIAFCLLAIKLPYIQVMPYKLLRFASMWLYFSHMIVLLAWKYIIYALGLDLSQGVRLIGGLAMALLVAYVLSKLQNTRRFAFLKKMT